MQAPRDYPSPSFLRRFLRGWRDLETALEMQPVDHLELRVAALERRMAELDRPAPRPTLLQPVKAY